MNKLPELDDAALAELFKVSPGDAYDKLCQLYWHKLFAFAAKQLQDEFAAKDIVQEIFLGLLTRDGGSTLPCPVVPYLYGAVKIEVAFELRGQLSRTKHMPDLTMYYDHGLILADQGRVTPVI